MTNNKKPSLYKKDHNINKKPSLYKKTKETSNSNRPNHITNIDFSQLSKISNIDFEEIKNNPKTTMNIIGIAVLILILIIVVIANSGSDNVEDIEKVVPTTTVIGNNSLGSVYKEGPYGNISSNVSIAYILGVHPREKGAHKLMEQALKEKADALNYTYYLYKINVTSASTDFSQSRLNGQKLAKEYAVPDMINNNFTFAVDVHYSNGHWGVSRFVFTPSENNTLSNKLGHDLANNFDWLKYYIPTDPSSPQYVTGPLNDGGVSAIIYEAYTEDDNNVTLEHDKEIIDFIDNWQFINETEPQEDSFFSFLKKDGM